MLGVGALVIFVYIFGFIFVVGALIYLVAKRINDKQKEDFEKRDN